MINSSRVFIAIPRLSTLLPYIPTVATRASARSSISNITIHDSSHFLKSFSPSSSTCYRFYSVYSVGSNANGALGADPSQGVFSDSPLHVKGFYKNNDKMDVEENHQISKISAGWGHSVVMSSSGSVYIFGRAMDMGNVLRWDRLSHILPQFFFNFMNKSTSYFQTQHDVFSSSPVQIYNFNRNTKSGDDIACSAGLTVIKDGESGELYTIGENKYGQCGNGDADSLYVFTPTKVDFSATGLKDSSVLPFIVDVKAGFQHCIALSKDGDVFTWGKGSRGQLGTGESVGEESEDNTISSTRKPQLVTFPEGLKMKQVASGFNYCVSLAQDGTVWTWGKYQSLEPTDNGKNFKDSFLPRMIEFPSKIENIWCGLFHSIARDVDGNIYQWGMKPNDTTSLSITDSFGSSRMIHLPIKIKEFVNTPKNTKISAGLNRTVALFPDTAEILEWDWDEPPMPSSWKSDVKNPIKDVSLGWKHALMLVDSSSH